MTHRNAEIWEKRHERVQAMRTAHHRHVNMAWEGAPDDDAKERIRHTQQRWLSRWDAVSQRAWHALCVAKGWRKG
jgi:hypothetical protein